MSCLQVGCRDRTVHSCTSFHAHNPSSRLSFFFHAFTHTLLPFRHVPDLVLCSTFFFTLLVCTSSLAICLTLNAVPTLLLFSFTASLYHLLSVTEIHDFLSSTLLSYAFNITTCILRLSNESGEQQREENTRTFFFFFEWCILSLPPSIARSRLLFWCPDECSPRISSV